MMRIDAGVSGVAEDAIRSLYALMQPMHYDSGSAVAMSAAIAESVADLLIDDLVSASGVSATPFGSKLLKESVDDLHRSWDARNSWLSGGFNIHLAGSLEWQRLDVVVQVRNALMHGQGSLTDRQTKDSLAALRLRRRVEEVLMSQLEGRVVVLSDMAGRCAVEVSIAYVLFLDRAVSSWKMVHSSFGVESRS